MRTTPLMTITVARVFHAEICHATEGVDPLLATKDAYGTKEMNGFPTFEGHAMIENSKAAHQFEAWDIRQIILKTNKTSVEQIKFIVSLKVQAGT